MSYDLPPPAEDQQFERLMTDLANTFWQADLKQTFQRYARNGQGQHGIDILGVVKEKRYVIQCKKIETAFRDPKPDALIEMMQEEVAKTQRYYQNTSPPLVKYIFATTTKNDKNVQEAATALSPKVGFTVEFWSWHTIAEYLSRFPDLLARYYPKALPRFLSHTPRLGTGFVGREAELKQMHERLTQEKSLLLVQGLGGIGKTTLASEYAERFHEDYRHILWVYFAADLATAFLKALTQKPEVAKALPGTDENACLEFLDGLPGPQKLLIVDNCTDSQAVHELKKVYKDWTLLFTSREHLRGLPKLELQVLTPEAARKLFAEHCSRRTDPAALEALLQEIGYHTLLITLCARLCEKSTRSDFLEDLRQKLQTHRLSEARLKTSNPDYSEKEQTLQAHLTTLHDLNPLPDFQKFLLQGFALWPSQPIPGEDLGTMTDTPPEKSDELTEALDDLVRQGWLRRAEAGEFTCHALTRHFIWDRLPPSLETAEPFFWGMAKCFDIPPTESPINTVRFFVLAEGLLAHFPQAETEAVANLCNNFGIRYGELGNLPASLRHNQRAVQIDEKILPANHPSLATSYNNLAEIHKDLGELPQAKEYHLKALAIFEAVLPANHPSLATSYNNLATVHYQLSELPQAKEYALKALTIREAVLPANHPDLATSYNNLAMIHKDLGELPQAKEYALKANTIWREVLPANHPLLATSYNNLALIHQDLGALPQAKEYHLKANTILREVLPANHPLLATSYHNLAAIHKDLGEWTEAEALFQKAIGILEAIFPNGHPNLNAARQNYRSFQEERTAAGK